MVARPPESLDYARSAADLYDPPESFDYAGIDIVAAGTPESLDSAADLDEPPESFDYEGIDIVAPWLSVNIRKLDQL